MSSFRAKLAAPLRRGEFEDLRGLVIDEPIELGAALLPNLDFSGTVFNAPLTLRDAVFQGLAWFIDCTFNAAVTFTCVRFLSDGRFDRARFNRGATFSGAEFQGVACFDQAEFGDAADILAACSGNAEANLIAQP